MPDGAPTLSDFTASDGRPPKPRMQKQNQVVLGSNTIGWRGVCPERLCRAYATERDSDVHKYHKITSHMGGAYAISDKILERLKSYGVGRIFIIEDDTHVLEWNLDVFAHRGRSVPPEFNPPEPQTFMPRDTVLYEWQNHAGDFYIPRDVEVPTPELEDHD